jgi:hypothetical protein
MHPSPPDDRFDPELLAAFGAPEPSPGLVDRAWARAAERRARRLRRRRWRAPVALAVAAVGVAAAAALLERRPDGAAASGELDAVARASVALGARAVAVAEPGAAVRWSIAADGAARVFQPRGDVFFRVEPGAAFAVTTPVAEVSVVGTCFRVEVIDMPINRQHVIGGAIGAAAAAAVIVTVYEGRVVLASDRGSIEIGAGERGRAEAGAAPVIEPSAPATVDSPTNGAPVAAPGALSRDALVARDRAHTQRIAALESELARLRAVIDAAQGKRPFEMSREELAQLAKVCHLPLDLPPTAGSSVMDSIVELGFAAAGFTDAEREVVQRIVARQQPAYETALRALHRELVGATESDESMDPMSVIMEIVQKSPPDQIKAAQKLVAEERAGLRPPPADPATGTVLERYFRVALAASDAFEEALAAELSPERAKVFRRTWGKVNLGPSCPEAGR